MVFPPIWGEKMAAFWACACKLSWTLLSPARVQPLYGAERKESSGTGLGDIGIADHNWRRTLMSWSRRMREIHDQDCSVFSTPEPTILLACGRNRELWELPFWNNKGNNWILPIRFNSVFIYGACPKWLLPDILVVPRGRAPFGQLQESRPLASSNDIPVLNGFVNTIDWDQNQSDLSDLTRNMRRVTGSPWIADFRC